MNRILLIAFAVVCAASSLTAQTSKIASTSKPAASTPQDDTSLQSEIQQALRNDPALAASQLSVHVSGDMVELSGAVPSGKEKQTAERLTRSYAVDRKVASKLTVSGQPLSSAGSQPSGSADAGKDKGQADASDARSKASAVQPK